MLEAETRKWEAREERLVEQLARMREELHVAKVERREDHVTQRGVDSSSGEAVQREVRFEAPSESSSVAVEQGSPVPQQDQSADAITDRLSQALLAQQLPTIQKFTGEERQQGGETIKDWKEQFEMVATLGGWDERSKLVNLVTRLRGQAYSFYRSCTMQQRSSYTTMMEELVKRFTPVRLQAVQSSQFHERKQKPQESVDDYAQDLCRLFHKAYPTAQRGSRETEELGQSVLSNQFVSGLKPKLKTKVAGMEGNFEQLLVKARFEEAKRRDITRPNFPKPPFQNRYRGQFKSGSDAKPEGSVAKPSGTQRQGQSDIKCYTCGVFGHISRNCPRNRRTGSEEAHGKPMQNPPNRLGTQVAAVVREQELQVEQDGREQQTYETQRQERELEGTLDRVAATMHGLSPTNKAQDSQLGPTLTAEVQVEGVTGSHTTSAGCTETKGADPRTVEG